MYRAYFIRIGSVTGLECYMPEAPHLIGYFDEDKMKQIIINLVSNALKYSPDKGEISVTVLINNQEKNFSVLLIYCLLIILRVFMFNIFHKL